MITGIVNDHGKFFLNISKISKNFKNFKKFKYFKFAHISETVRDRAKRSEFLTLAGLLHAQLQILKFSICCFLIGLYTFYNIIPVRSRNFFKYMLLRYFLETLRLKFSIFTSHYPQGHMTLQI